MRRLGRISLVLVIAALAGSSEGAQSPHLRLASDVWPPFTNTADKARIAVDLVHRALERGGVASTTSIVEWETVLAGIGDDLFDGSTAIWRTPEREQLMVFSEPYLENRLVLVGRKGSDVSASSFSELAGKRIAVVSRYAYGDALEEAAGVELVEGINTQANLDRLLAGETDYMLADALLVRYLREHQGEETVLYLEIGGKALIRRSLHLALRRDVPNAEAIIRAFNGEIRRMMADGTYNEILQLSWIRADVDGDGRLELVPRAGGPAAAPPVSGYSIVLPESHGRAVQISERFWIGGQVYESWAQVPPELKVPAGGAIDVGPPNRAVISLRFRK